MRNKVSSLLVTKLEPRRTTLRGSRPITDLFAKPASQRSYVRMRSFWSAKLELISLGVTSVWRRPSIRLYHKLTKLAALPKLRIHKLLTLRFNQLARTGASSLATQPTQPLRYGTQITTPQPQLIKALNFTVGAKLYGVLTPRLRLAVQVHLRQPKRTYMHVILAQQIREVSGRSLIAQSRQMTSLSTPVLIAAIGLPSELRYASISQRLIALATRRLLLTLDKTIFMLCLHGLIPGFTKFWRSINAASNEVYRHVLPDNWIADIGVSPKQAQIQTPRESIAAALESASLIEEPFSNASSLKLVLINTRAKLLQRLRRPGFIREIRAYTLRWVAVLAFAESLHGKVKRRRARGIKKRLAKRLVRLAKRRFWVV